jgi:hypothetical protein
MQIQHPYTDFTASPWLRGNLHAHTTRSDGKRPPQEVLNDYAARGYHFLMISDHDVYTSPQDYTAWDAKGMILIPGNEVSANGVHMLHVNATRRVEPEADRQKVIDAINADHNAKAFAIVNHPNWFADWNHCLQEDLEKWEGYNGIEIYNGVIGVLAGSQYATDRWDRLLSKGRHVWGYANDDSHRAGEVALGWNMVQAKEPAVAAISSALANGNFYASTGVVINNITVNSTRIRVEAENADRIVASTIHQKRFAVVDQSLIELDLAEFPVIEKYVRFECMGRGEQIAWTQPFYIEK